MVLLGRHGDGVEAREEEKLLWNVGATLHWYRVEWYAGNHQDIS